MFTKRMQSAAVVFAMITSGACLEAQTVNWSSLIPQPTPDGDYTLPTNTTVVLDVQPPRLSSLTIPAGSKLTLSTAIPLHIQCNKIRVQAGGTFEAGTSANPITHQVVISLVSLPFPTSPPPPPPVTTRGEFLVDPGGTLELHGDSRGDQACWTMLEEGATAEARDIAVQVKPPLSWRAGDRIVIASTDFCKVVTQGNPDVMHDQTEEFTIDGVTANGSSQTIALSGALAYSHAGVTVASSIEERAEVGLLNRSIRIEGGILPAHVMLGDPSSWRVPVTAHIEWTEFTNLGGLDAQGKPLMHHYPLHFHLVGDVPGSYVKNCSLHHNFNNNLVIHTTDKLLVDGNVFYDTVGWHLWLQTSQDHSQTEKPHVFTKLNVITNNLALLARDNGEKEGSGSTQTSTLDSAACFYITSFENEIRGNHAGSSEASGFYCDTREFYGVNYHTWTLHSLPNFQDNVAHSCGNHGFWLNGYTEFPRVDPKKPASLEQWAKFERFTAYKNNGFGFHCRNFGGVEWIDTQLADNGAGLYLASSGYWLQEYLSIGVMSGGRIVGESAENLGDAWNGAEAAYGRSLPTRRDHNLFFHIAGNPQQLCAPELTGVSMYDGLVHTEGVEFRGFEESANHTLHRGHSGAFSPAAYPNPWAVDPRNLAVACTFVPASPVTAVNRVWFREYVTLPAYPNGTNSVILNDMDGHVLGNPGVGGVVFPDANPLLNSIVPTGVDPNWNSSFKHSVHPFAQVVLFGFAPWNHLSTVSHAGGVQTVNPQLLPVLKTTLPGQQPDNFDYGVYMHPWNTPATPALGIPQHMDLLALATGTETLTGRITVLVTANAGGSVVDLKLPYTHSGTPPLFVAVGLTYAEAKHATTSTDVVGHASLGAWQAWVPPASGTRASYFHDGATSSLHLRVVLRPHATTQLTGPYARGGMFTGRPVFVKVQ